MDSFIKVNSNPIFIREIHFVKNYRVAHAANVKDKLVSRFVDFFDYELMIKKYDRVVVLTEKDRVENWHCRKDVVVMPNPLTQIPECKSDGNEKKVVAVGRLTEAKNFTSLLRAWAIVIQKHPDWTLNIWGSGDMKECLERDIDQLGLENKACLKGYTSLPLKAMSEGSIYALSSSFEGFPLVIIEAMSVGLPVVAYDCPYGPQDIITEGKDGFLVKLNNEDLLAEKICVLIEDNEKRLWMSSNAQKKASVYEIGVIAERWMKLFAEIYQGNSRAR